MGFFSIIRYQRRSDELRQIILASWERLQGYYRKNVEEYRVSTDFMRRQYGIDPMLLQTALCDKLDDLDLLLASQRDYAQIYNTLLIADQNTFDTINMMCNELTGNINELITIHKKMELNLSLGILTDYRWFLLKIQHFKKMSSKPYYY